MIHESCSVTTWLAIHSHKPVETPGHSKKHMLCLPIQVLFRPQVLNWRRPGKLKGTCRENNTKRQEGIYWKTPSAQATNCSSSEEHERIFFLQWTPWKNGMLKYSQWSLICSFDLVKVMTGKRQPHDWNKEIFFVWWTPFGLYLLLFQLILNDRKILIWIRKISLFNETSFASARQIFRCETQNKKGLILCCSGTFSAGIWPNQACTLLCQTFPRETQSDPVLSKEIHCLVICKVLLQVEMPKLE